MRDVVRAKPSAAKWLLPDLLFPKPPFTLQTMAEIQAGK